MNWFCPVGEEAGHGNQGEGARQNDAVAATATTSKGAEQRIRLQAALALLLRDLLRERFPQFRASCAPRRSCHWLRDQVCWRQFSGRSLCLDV